MTDLIFDKYENIKCLATGGMGDVNLARQRGLAGFDRLVILKSLRADLSHDSGFVSQFLDEARIIGALNHPNIVSVLEVGEWRNTHYIAMEYVEGPTLAQIWIAAARAGRGLPYLFSVRIVREAALGLAHAHDACDINHHPLQIVHRDISPQNIMVRQDGVVKVVDFGIAKSENKRTISQVNTIKGKLHYMSPEQMRNETVDRNTDQFALGIILWELTTGKRLFKTNDEKKTIQNVLKKTIPPPSSFIPSYPAALEAVVMRMLERDKERRYKNCDNAAAALRAFLHVGERKSGVVSVRDYIDTLMGQELEQYRKDLSLPAHLPDMENPETQEYVLSTVEDNDSYDTSIYGAFLIEKSDGTLIEFATRDQIMDWILENQVKETDLFSDDGLTWTPLQAHPYFSSSFFPPSQHSADRSPESIDGSSAIKLSQPRVVAFSGSAFVAEENATLESETLTAQRSQENQGMAFAPTVRGTHVSIKREAAQEKAAANRVAPNRDMKAAANRVAPNRDMKAAPRHQRGRLIFLFAGLVLLGLWAGLQDSDLTHLLRPRATHLASDAPLVNTPSLLDALLRDDKNELITLLERIAPASGSNTGTSGRHDAEYLSLIHSALSRHCLEENRLSGSSPENEFANWDNAMRVCQKHGRPALAYAVLNAQQDGDSMEGLLAKAHAYALHQKSSELKSLLEQIHRRIQTGSMPSAHFEHEVHTLALLHTWEHALWSQPAGAEPNRLRAQVEDDSKNENTTKSRITDSRRIYFGAALQIHNGLGRPRTETARKQREALLAQLASLPRDPKVLMLEHIADNQLEKADESP